MFSNEQEACSEDEASVCLSCENSVDDQYIQNEFSRDGKQQLVDFFSTLLEVKLEEGSLGK